MRMISKVNKHTLRYRPFCAKYLTFHYPLFWFASHVCGGIMVTSSRGDAFRITGPLRKNGSSWRPVIWNFGVSFVVSSNKLLNKQSIGQWHDISSRSCDVIPLNIKCKYVLVATFCNIAIFYQIFYFGAWWVIYRYVIITRKGISMTAGCRFPIRLRRDWRNYWPQPAFVMDAIDKQSFQANKSLFNKYTRYWENHHKFGKDVQEGKSLLTHWYLRIYKGQFCAYVDKYDDF